MNDFEENTYFKNVVRDAVIELKEKGNTILFFEDQVEAVKDIMQCDLNVKYDGTFYRVSLKK